MLRNFEVLAFNNRIFNFGAGPATLPLSVMQEVESEFLNYQSSGMSIVEMSHRNPLFEEIISTARSRAKKLLGLGQDYELLFLQGGARHQFAMVPTNFGNHDRVIDVIDSGVWTKFAHQEISRLKLMPHLVASTESTKYQSLPKYRPEDLDPKASYIHFCSNNTVVGTQWKEFLKLKGVRSVVDMSSDIFSRVLDFAQFDLIYAGAQKNIGPAGTTLVAIKKDWVDQGRKDIPEIFQYSAHIKHDSMYNTPCCFSIYVCGLVLKWIEDRGGLAGLESENTRKAKLLYSYLDQSSFYRSAVHLPDRSIMNVVFRIGDGHEALESKFVSEAEAAGYSGLKGHRLVGGLRASIYNAQSYEAVKSLTEFMDNFYERHKLEL